MKTCSGCKVQQSLENFHKDKSRRDGLNYRCSNCKNEYDREYRKKNPERVRAQHRMKDAKLRAADPEKYNRQWMIDYYKREYGPAWELAMEMRAEINHLKELNNEQKLKQKER